MIRNYCQQVYRSLLICVFVASYGESYMKLGRDNIPSLISYTHYRAI